MNALANARREFRLLARDRAFLVWALIAFLLSTLSVVGGISEVSEQRSTLARLVAADKVDREDAYRQQGDWGGAAYYSFHLTYDPPSDFAFAAFGTRDQAPWKHRIRMLALEGQIYERDVGNPVLALVGRFDFAFFAAYVVPLLLIVILHDLQSSERVAGRHELLESTAGAAQGLWRLRALLRVGKIAFVALVPLLVGCVWSGTSVATVLAATVIFLAYCAFWGAISFWFARRPVASEQTLSILVALWLLLGIVGPAMSRLIVDKAIPVPDGSEILMVQREAVNDAWDLPKEETMDAFLARHPEWSEHAEVTQPFHWKWYFAFQQVGDQKAEALSEAYRSGREARDRLAGLIAWLMPPALVERSFQRLADTDLQAQQAYERRVREFHAELRTFYYSRLFLDLPFAEGMPAELPEFSPSADA